MSDPIERYVSPDGERIAIVDTATGDVWLSRRLGPGETAEVMTLLASWTFRGTHPDDDDDDAPKEAPRKRARRSKKRAALTLMM